MTDILTAISTVGFPIVSFLICAWFIKYSYDRAMEQNKDALEKIGTLADAINRNTITLAELVEELKRGNENDN